MPYKISTDGTQLFGKQQLNLGRLAFKRIDNGTEVMHVNGQSAGADTLIWNGDDTAWTQNYTGTPTTGSAHSGSYGLDTGIVGANNKTEFDNGSEITVSGSYDQVSFWLQPKQFSGNGVLQMQWHNGVGTTIGSTLNVDNYVTNMDLDVWQHVSVPIADFNLSADVQRFWIVYKVGTQRHWIDDVHLQASGGGGPFVFRVQSPSGSIYHVEKLVLMVSATDTGWESSAFANITNGLENGVLVKYHKIGDSPETYWTFNSKNNVELFGQFEVVNDVAYSGGDRQFTFALQPNLSSVILVDDDEVLDIIVRDDLSSLNNVRAFLHYGLEEVPQ